MEGIDCASTVHDPAAVKAAGKHFVCRYLSTSGNPKNLQPAEAKALKAAGLGIVTVFETTANRAESGHAGGAADAASAEQQLAALGAPKTAPVFFAVDFDALDAAELAVINTYFAGASSVLGVARVGIYGGIHPVAHALDQKVCKYGWQTYAWSGGQWDPRAHLRQYHNGVTVAGISADLDLATVADYGQWNPPPPPRVWPKPDHWRVTYTTKAGERRTILTSHPGIWEARHPKARWRGPGVTQLPVFHKPKK